MRRFFLLLFLSAATSLVASTTAPQVLLGIGQPVAGAPVTVNVLVEGPANVAPVATGMVTLQWGDGSAPTTASLSYSLVTASHIYAQTGSYTVTAVYAGDANYSSLNATQAVLVLGSSPAPVTLNAFGDSITWGRGASVPANAYIDLVASAEGWALNNQGIRFDTSTDTCQTIGSVQPLPANAYNTLLTGQNDIAHAVASTPAENEFIAAITSCSVWLATTQGVNRKPASASANVLTGSWTPSTLYVGTGLNTMNAGDTLSGSFTGNVFYAQMSSTYSVTYTVSVSIDGAAAQNYIVPKMTYQGTRVQFAPFSVRIPLTGSNSAAHHVKFTCVTPGSTGCYVDWFAGNGSISRTTPPYLWVGTPYDNLQTTNTPAQYTQIDQYIRNAQAQLYADGLNVYLADTANWFNGPTDSACMYDQIHPKDCGHAILAATYINAMNLLLGQVSATALTVTPAPATAGQTATLTARVLTAAGGPTGSVTFSSEGQTLATVPLSDGLAEYSADTSTLAAGTYPVLATYLGTAELAASSATVDAVLSPAATHLQLSASPQTVLAPAGTTLTAQVSRVAGSGQSTGTVAFYYQAQKLGLATLSKSGTATLPLSSQGVPAGTYLVTATYGGDAADSASSGTVPVTVQ